MNLPVEDTRKEVATYEERLATEQPFPDDIQGIECIGAVDFAQIRDFCSVGILFKKDGNVIGCNIHSCIIQLLNYKTLIKT